MSHLTYAQRTLVEIGLRNRESFKAIAPKAGKSPSSVSREILKHRIDSDKGAYGRIRNRCPNVVEMDSVIGKPGGKVLLTLNFNNCTFLLAFLQENNTSQSMIEVFDHLNSIARASLNDIPAVTPFEQIYGEKVLKQLGVKLIDEVQLIPDLLLK